MEGLEKGLDFCARHQISFASYLFLYCMAHNKMDLFDRIGWNRFNCAEQLRNKKLLYTENGNLYMTDLAMEELLMDTRYYHEFAALYPKIRKVKEVEQQYCALIRQGGDDLHLTILAAIQKQERLLWGCRSQEERIQYIPDASNWLRDRRWEDKLPESDAGGHCGPVLPEYTGIVR